MSKFLMEREQRRQRMIAARQNQIAYWADEARTTIGILSPVAIAENLANAHRGLAELEAQAPQQKKLAA